LNYRGRQSVCSHGEGEANERQQLYIGDTSSHRNFEYKAIFSTESDPTFHWEREWKKGDINNN
jgi:hypothetical protein